MTNRNYNVSLSILMDMEFHMSFDRTPKTKFGHLVTKRNNKMVILFLLILYGTARISYEQFQQISHRLTNLKTKGQ